METAMLNIRALALELLIDIMEHSAYCDRALHHAFEKYPLERQERSFLMRLVEGTVERCIELDYRIDCFAKVKVKKQKPVIRNILRLSVYQIFYMDQVPDATACNEAVKLMEKRKLHNLKGFVNGILSTMIRERENITFPKGIQGISVRYSTPEWLVKRLVKAYGEERTTSILAASFEHPGMISVRCCTSRCQMEELQASLRRQNVRIKPGSLLPCAINISEYGTLQNLEAFQKGMFQVQDESSMLVGILAGIKSGDTVIDICSAPGGKAMHAADILNGTGRVIAADITSDKVALIRENCARLGYSNVELYVNDATVPKREWEGQADVLLADLPCSGLGVIRKKADIKYKTTPEDILTLADIQRSILRTAVSYVKPGGRLIYSTCTIAEEENEANVHFIEQELGLKAVSIEELLPERLQGLTGEKGYLQILPDMAGTDGFFIACFKK